VWVIGKYNDVENMNNKNINWYLNRLSRMSPGEVVYRVRNKVIAEFEKKRMVTKPNNPQLNLNVRFNNWCNSSSDVNTEYYFSKANQIILGRLDVFSKASASLGVPLNWNQDPRSGTVAPLEFGKTLNYRDETIVGDIKYLWEPSRHLQLVTLCQAYSFSGDKKYIGAFREQLESWIEQCPHMLGVHWTSSLELGIRLINWSICWQLIGGEDSVLFKKSVGEDFRDKWLTSIYQHCEFIAGHWSKYSSANNHLIGEAAGLFVGAVTWPYWESSEKWKKKSYKILIGEVDHQTFDDGVNKEQAISYQQFVVDFLLFSALCGKANGVEFPDEYWGRIEKMLEYMASLMDINGNLPMIGDADDGYVTALSRETNFCNFKSLLATGAVLFNRSDFKKKSGKFDDKTRFLLGEAGIKAYKNLDTTLAYSIKQCFSQAGYYILGDNFDTPEEVKLIVDSGPLGFLSIAAHGHADALSIYLSLGGREFLIDPGTYAYHTQQKWRDYFRGTSAHNTIRIDGLDQSVSGGNFMWLKHARAQCDTFQTNDDGVIFRGNHDGYLRLKDAVDHHRNILLDKNNNAFEIEDLLKCNGYHEVETFWHFSEDCIVSVAENGEITAVNGNKKIVVSPGQKVETNLYTGDENIPSGWVSRRFDEKTPITTIIWRVNIKGETGLKTKIFYE